MSPAPAVDEPVEVFGGDFVQSCGWPTTVSLEGQCTGALVHPQVVIYAAHCGASYGSVQFGEEISPGHSRSVPVQFCSTYPGGFSPGSGTDWALCVLSEPQTDIAIVPPLMGCEVEVLQADTPVTIVGFGEAETGYGDKKEVTTGFGYFQGNEAFLGGGGEDACFGDSGGPVFVQMPDSGSWRAFGITSYGSQNCMTGGYYSLMHVGMEWFEDESGFDLTPCHDAQGNWMPTPECAGFPVEPASAGGSWSDGCNPGELSGAESTCGSPFDASSDTDPPTVAFTSPENESRFDSDPMTGQAQVAIDLTADDGDGSGVASCPAPVTVTTEGTTTVTRVATDNVGNTASSTTVVRLDRVAPTGSITSSPILLLSQPVTGTATDLTSGVASVQVRFTRGGTTTVADATLSCTDGSCTWQVPNPGGFLAIYSVEAVATDVAGNTATIATQTLTLSIGGFP